MKNVLPKMYMKKHLPEHSYRNLKYKCEEDIACLEVQACEVHSENVEFDLCIFT